VFVPVGGCLFITIPLSVMHREDRLRFTPACNTSARARAARRRPTPSRPPGRPDFGYYITLGFLAFRVANYPRVSDPCATMEDVTRSPETQTAIGHGWHMHRLLSPLWCNVCTCVHPTCA
jgi:hypothetical protein